jgi:hypothetical protein
MEIIAASTDIMLLVALGFGILSVWDITANACTAVRSALTDRVVRSSDVFDTSAY